MNGVKRPAEKTKFHGAENIVSSTGLSRRGGIGQLANEIIVSKSDDPWFHKDVDT
jgi:hypothetical protein